ncbi:MAG: hypothetical protein IJV13_04040 [Prevotella sp.]|nr:hypothetical protein [Prevotella sp.]
MKKTYMKPNLNVVTLENTSALLALSVGSGTKSADEALSRQKDDLLSFDIWEDRGLFAGDDEEEE